MLIDQIKIYKKKRYFQLLYGDDTKIQLDNVHFTIENKYDTYNWLINIDPVITSLLYDINEYLIDKVTLIKCQKKYLNNKKMVVKIKTLKDKIILDTNINILDDVSFRDKELIGSIYLDQIWLYKGEYCYKWKVSSLRFKD